MTEKERCPQCGSPRVEPSGFSVNEITEVWTLERQCKTCKHRWWFTFDKDGVRHDPVKE